jgi:selT/selW/selH-like putative selenoprotein
VELDRGGGGVFDVFVDGDLVYSKADTGRFPHADEVTKILKNRH